MRLHYRCFATRCLVRSTGCYMLHNSRVLLAFSRFVGVNGRMTTITQRTEVRAHDDSIRFAPTEIVGGLREILGSRLVAYLGRVNSTRQVDGWAKGTIALSDDKLERLRAAYHIAALLRDHEGSATVQAWFKGMNPQLEDQAPAQLLREQPLESAGPAVLAAARAFAFVG